MKSQKDLLVLVLCAVAVFVVPCLILALAIQKKWVNEEQSEKLIQGGILAFALIVVVPVLQKAMVNKPVEGQPQVRKSLKIFCICLGAFMLLMLVIGIIGLIFTKKP